MAYILDFPENSTTCSDADEILKKSLGDYKTVVVCGYDTSGIMSIKFNDNEPEKALWSLQKAITILMEHIE